MAIDGIRVDEPFYFSSAGSADEASIVHDGSNWLLNNGTGKTKFGNGSTYLLTLDHTNIRLGVGTETPGYSIHASITGANGSIAMERTSYAICYMNATTTNGNFGTINNYAVRIIVNSAYRVVVDTSGNLQVPAAYTTVISGVNTDLYVDSTGLIGPLPSASWLKENVRELKPQETEWIFQIPVKRCDYKDGAKDIITVVSEEAEAVNQQVVRYGLFEISDNGEETPVSEGAYDRIEEEKIKLKPGQPEDVMLRKNRFSTKDNEEDMIIHEWKRIVKRPITVNRSDLIYPMLHQVQQQRGIIDTLLARINKLEKEMK